MKKQMLTILLWAFAIAAPVHAASDCESKAVGKDGKPLSGAAKTAFMKKCEHDSGSGALAACEAKAVSSDGKPLAGAARASSIKKCMGETK